MPTVILCQLVTLPDGRRMRVYWQGRRQVGEVEALPTDRDRPDGEYWYDTHRDVMTLIERYDR